MSEFEHRGRKYAVQVTRISQRWDWSYRIEASEMHANSEELATTRDVALREARDQAEAQINDALRLRNG